MKTDFTEVDIDKLSAKSDKGEINEQNRSISS